MQPIMSEPHVHQFVLLLPASTRLFFFCRHLSIGCATALPMGVAPEAIAEIFGYRLKKIDKLAPYISSRVICRLYSPLQWISPLFMSQAPESKTR
jgi:hypothetical protein